MAIGLCGSLPLPFSAVQPEQQKWLLSPISRAAQRGEDQGDAGMPIWPLRHYTSGLRINLLSLR